MPEGSSSALAREGTAQLSVIHPRVIQLDGASAVIRLSHYTVGRYVGLYGIQLSVPGIDVSVEEINRSARLGRSLCRVSVQPSPPAGYVTAV